MLTPHVDQLATLLDLLAQTKCLEVNFLGKSQVTGSHN